MSFPCYGCLDVFRSGRPYQFGNGELQPTREEINWMRRRSGQVTLEEQKKKFERPPKRRVFCSPCVRTCRAPTNSRQPVVMPPRQASPAYDPPVTNLSKPRSQKWARPQPAHSR
jgi:hypothetical protein